MKHECTNAPNCTIVAPSDISLTIYSGEHSASATVADFIVKTATTSNVTVGAQTVSQTASNSEVINYVAYTGGSITISNFPTSMIGTHTITVTNTLDSFPDVTSASTTVTITVLDEALMPSI